MVCFSLIGNILLVGVIKLWHWLAFPQVQNIIVFVSSLVTVAFILLTYNLSKSQDKLQDRIAKDNLKAMFYKHQVYCYLQLVQILYSVQNNFTLKTPPLYEISPKNNDNDVDMLYIKREFIEKLLELVKVQKEANLLFHKENTLYEINTIFKMYNSYVENVIFILEYKPIEGGGIDKYLNLKAGVNSVNSINNLSKCYFLYNPKDEQYSEPKPEKLRAYTKDYDDLVEYYKSGKLDSMVSEELKVTNLDAYIRNKNNN